MEARARKLEEIFEPTITYQIPLFQRPYVWEEEKHWIPLWDDIQGLLLKSFLNEKNPPHFLGAVVLERLDNTTGSIQTRQVIDGQQRFTTIQLFLIAARDHAKDHIEKYYERFNDLVSNNKNKIDTKEELYKVWPTNSNREVYKMVHNAGSVEALDTVVRDKFDKEYRDNIIECYKFFYGRLKNWLDSSLDEEFDHTAIQGKSIDIKLDALWGIVKEKLQLVVIDLDRDDETQIIFETLNARGEPLLPADLIKNYLFRRASSDHEDIEGLYNEYWKEFDQNIWWRKETKQGRISRTRIDMFINYYLSMMLCEDIKSSQLFNTYKYFVEDTCNVDFKSAQKPQTAAEHLISLCRYSKVFKRFYEKGFQERWDIFLSRLDAVDTTTVFPFLLYAHANLVPNNIEEFNKILDVIESYLIRRMICGLTAKNYNKIFVDLTKFVRNSDDLSSKKIIAFFEKSNAESIRFPTNEEVRDAIMNKPLYGRLTQYKVRAILEALNLFEQTRKSEKIVLLERLTIEHIMPQNWEKNWSLQQDVNLADIELKQAAILRRKAAINNLGNLTLITGSLNPVLSNSEWKIKRSELLKFSRLNLTQYFHDVECSEVWDEERIYKRAEYLLTQIEKIWPSL